MSVHIILSAIFKDPHSLDAYEEMETIQKKMLKDQEAQFNELNQQNRLYEANKNAEPLEINKIPEFKWNPYYDSCWNNALEVQAKEVDGPADHDFTGGNDA